MPMENRWKVPDTVFSHVSVTFLVLPPVLLRCSGRSVPTECRAVSPTTGSFSHALSSAAPRHQLRSLVLGPGPGCPHVKPLWGTQLLYSGLVGSREMLGRSKKISEHQSWGLVERKVWLPLDMTVSKTWATLKQMPVQCCAQRWGPRNEPPRV